MAKLCWGGITADVTVKRTWAFRFRDMFEKSALYGLKSSATGVRGRGIDEFSKVDHWWFGPICITVEKKAPWSSFEKPKLASKS